MIRKIGAFLLLSISSALCLSSQEWSSVDSSSWTDKNNTEQYARYLILAAYGEQGYLGAKVDGKLSGAKVACSKSKVGAQTMTTPVL